MKNNEQANPQTTNAIMRWTAMIVMLALFCTTTLGFQDGHLTINFEGFGVKIETDIEKGKDSQ